MQNRVPPRVRRTFDTRKDMAFGRAPRMWSPTSLAPNEQALSRHVERGVSTPPKTLRILVVDNDMRAADSLELLLHAGGYSETRVAYSAHGALAIADEFCPDVVLVELDMRDIGSYQLGQTLTERAQLRRVRLIAVTDGRAHQGRDMARDAGFERYLLKPITAQDLSACLSDEASARR